MSLTLDEWNKRKPAAIARATRVPQNPDVFVREAVRIEALTGDENWDFFLTYLEAAARAAEAQLIAEDAKLRSPYLVNDEAIRALKAQITRIEERIATLKDVMRLPKFLKERGDLARAQIADLAKGA